MTCKEIYFQDHVREDEIKKLILTETPKDGFVWDTNRTTNLYNQEIAKYLIIADEIAKKGYQCSSWDDYSPGYFSEISIIDNEIVLKQINYRNSRSIDHKSDYYLRDLEIYIPLEPSKEKESALERIGFSNYQIGEMRICFSDRSSEKNKHCSNAIKDQISEEINRFKANH